MRSARRKRSQSGVREVLIKTLRSCVEHGPTLFCQLGFSVVRFGESVVDGMRDGLRSEPVFQLFREFPSDSVKFRKLALLKVDFALRQILLDEAAKLVGSANTFRGQQGA